MFLRREKRTRRESLLYSETVKCVWGSMAWRAEQRVQEIRGVGVRAEDATNFYKQR